MARNKKRTPSAKPLTDFQRFRRALHAKGDPRRTIQLCREQVHPAAISDIVKKLGTTDIYRHLLSPAPFPQSYDQIKPRKFVAKVDDAVEALWTASTLALFVSELRRFVELKNGFHHEITFGEYQKADHSLTEIERELGVSSWSIAARIALLQLEKGTPNQKEYLEKILDTRGLHPFVAFLSFFASFRAEPNVSMVEVTRELLQIDLAPALVGYLRYHANPLALTEVQDPWSCVSFDLDSPIVDRFETFVDMATLAVVRNEQGPMDYLREALALIAEVPDPRIRNLLVALGDTRQEPWIDAQFLQALDKYSIGAYADAASIAHEQLGSQSAAIGYWEVAARAESNANIGSPRYSEGSLLQRGMVELRLLSSLDGVISRARLSLQKVAMLIKGHPLARFVPAYFDRTMDPPIADRSTEAQAVWALSSPASNPMHLRLLRDAFPILMTEVMDHERVSSSQTMALYASALALRAEPIDIAGVPEARAAQFRGYLSFNSGNYSSALAEFSNALAKSTKIDAMRRSTAMYAALRKLNELDRALELFCELYLMTENALSIVPLGDLAQWAASNTGTNTTALHRAIAFHAYSVHVGANLEQRLSDAFEDTLDCYAVRRPTELLVKVHDHGVASRALIYFLRHVCTIRRLEDSTEFENYEEVEDERIRILQGLQDLDPARIADYAGEIRAISQAAEIARLKAEFDRSRIYVNEAGVLQSINDELSDSYARYTELTAKPDLERSVEGIEKRIKQLLRESNVRLEMQPIRLPSTERTGLFNSMLDLAVNEFVINPNHGLQTYLSTRILHGALEGELRASFAMQDLSFNEGEQAAIAESWQSRLRLSPREWQAFESAIIRFGKRLSELIDQLKNQLIRIRFKETPDGLFQFVASDDDLKSLQQTAARQSNFEEFIGVLFGYCWDRVEQSLIAIREELTGPFAKRVESALDTLSRSVTNRTGAPVPELEGAIGRARTDFAFQLDRIVSWFARAGAPPTEPFSIETLVGVATAITNNCWPKRLMHPHIEASPALRLRGVALIPLIEILMNCFQNANQHSGFNDRSPDVEVQVELAGDKLAFRVSNSLAPNVDGIARRQELEERIAECLAVTDSHLVSREGGTGFRKMLRVLTAEALGDGLQATIGSDGKASVAFRLRAERVVDETSAG